MLQFRSHRPPTRRAAMQSNSMRFAPCSVFLCNFIVGKMSLSSQMNTWESDEMEKNMWHGYASVQATIYSNKSKIMQKNTSGLANANECITDFDTIVVHIFIFKPKPQANVCRLSMTSTTIQWGFFVLFVFIIIFILIAAVLAPWHVYLMGLICNPVKFQFSQMFLEKLRPTIFRRWSVKMSIGFASITITIWNCIEKLILFFARNLLNRSYIASLQNRMLTICYWLYTCLSRSGVLVCILFSSAILLGIWEVVDWNLLT